MQEDKEWQNDKWNELDVEIVNLGDETLNKKEMSRSSFRTRFSPRQRRMQGVVTISVVMLALLLIIASNGAIRSKFAPSPTPTQVIPLGTDHFYVSAEPGWGHLLVDGKLVEHIPNPDDNSPVRLARGTHILQWDAFPFTRQECTISVPPNYHTDTCAYNAMLGNGKDSRSGWLFSFHASLTGLPDPQRTSLITAVQNALQSYTSSEIVQPGEAYALDALDQRQAVAHEPLKVTIRYQLDTNTKPTISCGPVFMTDGSQSCTYQGQDCRAFCTSFGSYPAPTQINSHAWNVFAVMRATSEYTTLSGKVVAHYSSDDIEPLSSYEHLVPLQILWDGVQWHVTSSFSLFSSDVQFTSPVCDTALGKQDNDTILSTTFESSYFGMDWSPVAVPRAPASCLGVSTMPLPLTSAEGQPAALCLYRFGIFLAANDLAHKYWPHMQIANATEQHLAQQLYKTFISTPSG